MPKSANLHTFCRSRVNVQCLPNQNYDLILVLSGGQIVVAPWINDNEQILVDQ